MLLHLTWSISFCWLNSYHNSLVWWPTCHHPPWYTNHQYCTQIYLCKLQSWLFFFKAVLHSSFIWYAAAQQLNSGIISCITGLNYNITFQAHGRMSKHGNSSPTSDTAISIICLSFLTRGVVLRTWYHMKSTTIRFKRSNQQHLFTSHNSMLEFIPTRICGGQQFRWVKKHVRYKYGRKSHPWLLNTKFLKSPCWKHLWLKEKKDTWCMSFWMPFSIGICH